MITHTTYEVYKKPDQPNKPPLSAFFALNEALRQANYTITLKPVNGVNLHVIERAA